MKKQRDIRGALSEFRKESAANERDRNALALARTEIRSCLRTAFYDADKVKFLTQGSYRYRTLNRPCHPPVQQMDMDDGMYFSDTFVGRTGVTPARLLAHVADGLRDLCARQKWDLSTDKPSCVRIILCDDKHVDIPVYRAPDADMKDIAENQHTATSKILTDWGLDNRFVWGEGKVQLAHREDGWKDSDPRNIIHWVAGRVEKYGELYLRLCRMLKVWRDHQWPKKSPLSSILIMAAVDAAMREGCVDRGMSDDDALYQVAGVLEDVLHKGVPDPDESVKNSLTGSLSSEDMTECARKLQELYDVLKYAMYERDAEDCAKELRRVFGEFFPADSAFVQKCAVATAITATTSAAASPRPFACTTGKRK